jgi:hypothetical protein
MALFDWLKKRPSSDPKQEHESDYELASRVASALDSYIDMEGLQNFESDELTLFVTDSSIAISASAQAIRQKILIAIPLHQIKLNRIAIEAGGPLRHRVVDMAAYDIVRQILWNRNSN